MLRADVLLQRANGFSLSETQGDVFTLEPQRAIVCDYGATEAPVLRAVLEDLHLHDCCVSAILERFDLHC